jgi:hypothetical protein
MRNALSHGFASFRASHIATRLSATTGCAFLCALVGHIVVKLWAKSMGLQRVVIRTCTKLSEHPVMLT